MIRVTFFMHCGHQKTVFVAASELNDCLKQHCCEGCTYSEWQIEAVNFN